ncbi:hypothetical protein CR66_07670 [Campylobacter mucosalis]|uniref:NTP transferase domain-containing protein n=1 Tax=Campylobacter mucosalis TaxID=202 RepID=UPI0004DA1469|nr:NTP transferase domain-containing protein [Campylobacter mucosalis]KEA45390.1 hypothetical protein CR66_07670 [Campylobacter mucosalis]QKF63832.1 phosphocholine cytidylyltransferase [Campylobacter mucosalis]
MNAIILAAGFGSRLKELTKSKHKALFDILGEPNIERTIKFLNERDISEIYVITGYLSENFSYLEQKFGVKLIKNENFHASNNLASFALALPYFGDSFVIDADVVLLKNIFQIRQNSHYYTTIRANSQKPEWIIKTQENRVVGIEISALNAPSLLGISYFNKTDADVIKRHILSLEKSAFLDPKKYYDNAVLDVISDINMGFLNVPNELVGEIDDKDDLDELNLKIKRLKCEN